jgi:hypothetical protein
MIMNFRLLASFFTALAISSTFLPFATSQAQAQMTMRFTTPFVTDAGFLGAGGDKHFITVAITGFALESATVALPLDMARNLTAKVVDQKGKEIASTTKVSPDGITINFAEPVKPDAYVTIQLSGVDMSSMGGRVLYRVSTQLQGIKGEVPIGSAMVSLKTQN